MKLDKIPVFKHEFINVVIETPKGCRNKYNYEPELKLFRLKKTLPMGMMFPFDFGFIPNTMAEDGDPLDVLVIMEEPAYPGCLVECRLLGIIEAIQTEVDGTTGRNDRIVAIAKSSIVFADIQDVNDLNKKMISEIEHFFIFYNKEENKNFKPVRWGSAEDAAKLIKKGMK